MEGKVYKNHEMEAMMGALEKHLDRKDIIGYAAARNVRVLRDELREYFEMRSSLVEKYGEPMPGEDGEPTGQVCVSFESENYPKFIEELETFAVIEHEPRLFRIGFEHAIGNLSGTELLEVDWMFEE